MSNPATFSQKTSSSLAALLNRSSMLYSARSAAKLAVLAAGVMASGNAYANPEGGNVTSGTANISNSAPNVLDINQSSQKAIIDWRSFNINHGETTNFNQPNARAVTLNRVNGSTNPSQILGNLNANGTVMIVDPNGVFFGAGSRVNVGGLVVSTADISDDNFNNGKYKFDRAGNKDAKIENYGDITASQAGLVALVASNVRNDGAIVAEGGKVVLAGAEKATVSLDGGLISFEVGDAKSTSVVNSGDITGQQVVLSAAQAKDVVSSVVNQKGTVRAKNLVTGKGGEIILTGGEITVASGSTLDASGPNGGGTISIGGGKHSTANVSRNADKVTIEKEAVIKANADSVGNGGNISIWSEKATKVAGALEAKGGANGGNGGFVETSSSESLKVTESASVNVGAVKGKGNGGTWLLDPEDIIVGNAGSLTATVFANTLQNTLNLGGNVILETNLALAGNGDITFDGAKINKTSGGDGNFIVKAYRDIIMNNGTEITSTSGKLNVTLNSRYTAAGNGAISLFGTQIITNGGNIVMGGGIDPTNSAAIGSSATNRDGVSIINSTINAANGGNITLYGLGFDNEIAFGVSLVSSNIIGGGNGTTIKMKGDGGNGGIPHPNGRTNNGIDINNSNVSNTGSGTINLDGAGHGTGNSPHNAGVKIHNGSSVTTENGNIDIFGRDESTSSHGSNMGVYVVHGAKIQSTGSGNINIKGQSKNLSGGAYGVLLDINSEVLAGTGNIEILGTAADAGGFGVHTYGKIYGGGNGSLIHIRGNGGKSSGIGVAVNGGSDIVNTGTGQIKIEGFGGGSTGINSGYNYGINVGNGGKITVENGSLEMVGVGGGSGSGAYNSGIATGQSSIKSTGTGLISLNGTGGNNAGSGTQNTGVWLGDAIQSAMGSIEIYGKGGDASGGVNYGTVLLSSITGGGNGTHVTITGNGGNGTGADNSGTYISGNVSNTGDGTILINGNGGGTGPSGLGTGFYLGNGGNISSEDGNINIFGNGGIGVFINNGSTVKAKGGITAFTGQGTVSGILASGLINVGDAATTGDIYFRANTQQLVGINAGSNIQTSGIIKIIPETASGSSYGVGNGAYAGKDIMISDAMLDAMHAGRLEIGHENLANGNFTVNTNSTLHNKTWFIQSRNDTSVFNLQKTINSDATGTGAVAVVSGNVLNDTSVGNAFNMIAGGIAEVYVPKYKNGAFVANDIGSDIKAFARENSSFYTASDNDKPNQLVNTLHYYDRAALTIDANDKGTFTYGDVIPGYNGATDYTLAGALAVGDSISGVTLGDNATYSTSGNRNAGNWTVSASNALNGSGQSLALDGYDITYTTGNLTVNKKTLTPSVNGPGNLNGNNKVYDGTTIATIDATGAVVPGLILGDFVSYDTSGVNANFSDKNAGNGKGITVTGLGLSGADAANYDVTQPVGLTANITRRALSVNTNDTTMIYGDAIPTATANYVGLVSGESPLNTATLYSAPFGSTSSSGNLKAANGVYSIFQTIITDGAGNSGANFNLNNYDLTLNGGALDVLKRNLNVDYNALSKIYDGTTTAAANGPATLNNLIAGDLVASNFADANFDNKNAGNGKTVTFNGITISGADAANYDFNTSDTALANITAKDLLITADNKTRIYGDANPALTYTQSGLVAGDSIGGGLTTSATINSNVGLYDITQGSLDAGSNYTINFTKGGLTINPATLQVSAVPVNTTVGNVPSPLPYNSSGFKLNDNASLFTGGLVSNGNNGSPAGQYSITLGTLNAGPNYIIDFTGGINALTISAAPAPAVGLNGSVQRFEPQNLADFSQYSYAGQLLPNTQGQPQAPQFASNPATANLNMASTEPVGALPGSGADLNNLSPAAGGEDLNNLSPAAGGDEETTSTPSATETNCAVDYLRNSLSNTCNIRQENI